MALLLLLSFLRYSVHRLQHEETCTTTSSWIGGGLKLHISDCCTQYSHSLSSLLPWISHHAPADLPDVLQKFIPVYHETFNQKYSCMYTSITVCVVHTITTPSVVAHLCWYPGCKNAMQRMLEAITCVNS